MSHVVGDGGDALRCESQTVVERTLRVHAVEVALVGSEELVGVGDNAVCHFTKYVVDDILAHLGEGVGGFAGRLE